MKKKFLYCVMATLLLVSSIIFIESCKKQQIMEPLLPEEMDYASELPPEVSRFVKSVKRFDTEVRQCLANEQKAESFMTSDSAAWNIESLLNTKYASPEVPCDHTLRQELYFDLPLNKHGVVKMSEVAKVYETIENAVRDSYISSEIYQDKIFRSVAVNVEDDNGKNCSLKVNVLIGKRCSANYPLIDLYDDCVVGPFKKSESWYYGEYGGLCDDPSYPGDAAEQIQDMVNYYYAWNHGEIDETRILIVNLKTLDVHAEKYYDEQRNKYKIFHYPYDDYDHYCLDGSEMNYYFKMEGILLTQDVKEDNGIPSDSEFLNVDNTGGTDGEFIKFDVSATYGKPLEIPVKSIGKAKDISRN